MTSPSKKGSKESQSRTGSRKKRFKVCLIGAAGGIGQPLALLLKMDPLVARLHLYDVAPLVKGVAADLADMNTSADVAGFTGSEAQMREALTGADVVLSVAGVTIRPGQTRDDVFAINAGILASVAQAIADVCPLALVACVSNPVNSLVPLMHHILRSKGVAGVDQRLFGVCTLDVVRACTFAAEVAHTDRASIQVPVIGAHAGATIIPLPSQATPHPLTFADARDADRFHTRVQEAGIRVLEAKGGKGTATLSMAFAAARFAHSLMRASRSPEERVIECAFVRSDSAPAGVSFFSNPLLLAPSGVARNLGTGPLSPDEEARLNASLPQLRREIDKGIAFAKAFLANHK